MERRRWYVGTSGFSYRPWRGPFYPEDLPAERMLRFYGERLPAVEINSSFYRVPSAATLAGWCREVPPEFRFAFKAPRRITHLHRLKGGAEEVAYFLGVVESAGERLGAVLFQLPPTAPLDTGRLEKFLEHLPRGVKSAFEFRHGSWLVEETFALLSRYGCALCLTEDEGESRLDLPSTAPWGYLRLRKPDYGDGELAERARHLRERGWEEGWVFFKHEDEGKGPRLAARFLDLLREEK